MIALLSFFATISYGHDEDEQEPDAGETEVSGYAELTAEWWKVGTDPRFTGVGRLRRASLEVEHELGPDVEAEVELEVENAIASSGGPGTAEIEEAFLAWEASEGITIHGGLILVPFGWLNLHHEPIDFNGVERPSLDQTLVPTTWRELGAGVIGSAGPLTAEVDLMSALDPTGFDDSGVLNGRTLGADSPLDSAALAARIEVEPLEDFTAAVSLYASDVGGAERWYDAGGDPIRLSLPILAAEGDLRYADHGVEARAEGAVWSLPQSDDLMEAHKVDGSPWFPEGSAPVPTAMIGGYAELGYDVLDPFDSTFRLVPFARLERYDTQWGVPDGQDPNPLRTVSEGTFGASFHPSDAIVFKGDVQLRDRKLGDDELGVNFGLGWAF
jgi:hypothetical protein